MLAVAGVLATVSLAVLVVLKLICVELDLLGVLLLGLGDELGVIDGGWRQTLLGRRLLLQVAAAVDWYGAPGPTFQVHLRSYLTYSLKVLFELDADERVL